MLGQFVRHLLQMCPRLEVSFNMFENSKLLGHTSVDVVEVRSRGKYRTKLFGSRVECFRHDVEWADGQQLSGAAWAGGLGHGRTVSTHGTVRPPAK